MDQNPKITTEEKATEKEVINGLELAAEIQPLLDDYFCGSFETNAKGVLMKMDNGQVFQLTVSEVA